MKEKGWAEGRNGIAGVTAQEKGRAKEAHLDLLCARTTRPGKNIGRSRSQTRSARAEHE